MLHELRHAIFVLQATVQLDPNAVGHADLIDRVRELTSIVEFYGSFSRPIGPPVLTDLAAEVTELWPAIVRQAQARGARVELDSRAPSVLVLAAPLAARQILVNLVRNALDALAAQEERRVRIAVQCTPAGGRLRVDDSGPGLEPPVAERVFDPWFTTKGGEGTGLGLPVCKRLAERDGATITVGRSDLGGASFQVCWPPVPSAASP